MQKMSYRMIFLSTILALTCIAGCSDDNPLSNDNHSLTADREHLESLEQAIWDYSGELLCSNVGDCRYIGMGVNPCGGPNYYLVYSTSNVDSLMLADMVSEHNQYNDELNERYGLSGPCVVPNIPNLDCQDGQCVDLGYPPK